VCESPDETFSEVFAVEKNGGEDKQRDHAESGDDRNQGESALVTDGHGRFGTHPEFPPLYLTVPAIVHHFASFSPSMYVPVANLG